MYKLAFKDKRVFLTIKMYMKLKRKSPHVFMSHVDVRHVRSCLLKFTNQNFCECSDVYLQIYDVKNIKIYH